MHIDIMPAMRKRWPRALSRSEEPGILHVYFISWESRLMDGTRTGSPIAAQIAPEHSTFSDAQPWTGCELTLATLPEPQIGRLGVVRAP